MNKFDVNIFNHEEYPQKKLKFLSSYCLILNTENIKMCPFPLNIYDTCIFV